MATESIPTGATFDANAEAKERTSLSHVLIRCCEALASLKLTVTLFVLSIFIILVGTLAQVDKNMWEVMEAYFRSYIAWIDLQVFVPRTWFPNLENKVPFGFPFPGGALIGLAMIVNLLAAHLLRFRVQARGSRLWSGLAITGVGALITYLVIASGHNNQGLQGKPFFEWATLWLAIKMSLAFACLGCLYWFVVRQSWSERLFSGPLFVMLLLLTGWLFYSGEQVTLGDSSLRILWQLIQGGMAAGITLVGCVFLFRKRAGIVLLHAGVGLIMLGELLVSKFAVEERMTIAEGQTVNYARDIREVELAVIDRESDAEQDHVVAIPESLLTEGSVIQHEALPFDIEIDRFFPNSTVRRAVQGEDAWATHGTGKDYVAEELRPGSGTDGGEIDQASVYVVIKDKTQGDTLGKYLLSQVFYAPMQSAVQFDESMTVEQKTYDVALRFRHNYKPYSMHLIDVRKDDYVGTDTPRNYSSDVRLVDGSRSTDREVRIWMNNPLRYAGETFYQSSYQQLRDGTEVTDLQVVSNLGWMIPYVGCMLVGTGMFFQFGNSLLRFQSRMETQSSTRHALPVDTDAPQRKKKRRRNEEPTEPSSRPRAWVVPAVVVACFGLWLMGKARVPTPADGKMDLVAFGRLPICYQGRVKPVDSLARNSLRVISNRETFTDEAGNTQPAVRWLLDAISQSPAVEQHQVFKIESLDVLKVLGLERRKRFRYAIEEFGENIDEFNQQAAQAHRVRQNDGAEHLDTFQRKVLDLDRRIRTYTLLRGAFHHLPIPAFPSEEEFRKDPQAMQERLVTIRENLEKVAQLDDLLRRYRPPLAVPDPEAAKAEDNERRTWLPYASAWHQAYIQNIRGDGGPVFENTRAWENILNAYLAGDAGRFNSAVSQYHRALQGQSLDECNLSKIQFETWFNHFAPFYHCAALYVIAFVLVVASWLVSPNVLRRTATWLVLLTFVVHTLGLVARIYISGRAPVINLYSTAPFIGWTCVALGLLLEYVYRMGIGNVLGTVAGFSSLVIAHFLSGDGDTITVLQAVLDTQFWLTTHVITINLGYAATILAGLAGIIFVGMGLFGVLSPDVRKTMERMIYGILCFALFFSFVGTVLGGLWADDSWGRFWGWDPKENGALMIVLWNALALHARWGKMVGARGLALLAVGGNIITSWSWFGVNELGIGLHSYGFKEGTLRVLGIFWLSQLVIMIMGLLPLAIWSSRPAQGKNQLRHNV